LEHRRDERVLLWVQGNEPYNNHQFLITTPAGEHLTIKYEPAEIRWGTAN
jgi:hypothetical protein